MAEEAVPPEQQVGWIRLPKEGEILGVVIGTLGGGRLAVACKDGKDRICRIPGKYAATSGCATAT